MSVLSVITVRKGSKGLKDKCLKRILGKAVFEYVIEYSLELNRRLGGRVFTLVSSDSEAIQRHCLRRRIPFIYRPADLASDSAQIEEVVYDAYNKIDRPFEYILLLYGNIPTRYPASFIRAYDFLATHKHYDAAMSFQKVEKYNPLWMFELNERTLPRKKCGLYRRQQLKKYIIHDGHTILFRSRHFLEFMKKAGMQRKHGLYDAFGKEIKPMLNEDLIVDIDTRKDLWLAEAILSYHK
jgi:CMP-N-acetylneuraminic acid synthetase